MNYLGIGKKIYDLKNWREAHRCLVFVIRCLLHPCRMQRLENFFNSTPLLKKIAAEYAFVYEQPTRAFFYNETATGFVGLVLNIVFYNFDHRLIKLHL